MTLQVFNPTESSDTVVFPSNDKQIAEQLLADCVAEMKSCEAERKKEAEHAERSPTEATMAMIERLQSSLLRTLKIKDYESGVAILNATQSQQTELVLLAMSSLVKNRYGDAITDSLCHELLKSLLRRKLTYDDAVIARMLTLVVADTITFTVLPVLSILSNVQRHVEQNGMSKSVRTRLKRLARTFYPEASLAEYRKIGVRLKALLDSPHAKADLRLQSDATSQLQLASQIEPESLAFDFNTGEAWTNALLVELGRLTDDSRNNWHQLLDHCGTAKSSKPTKKWLKRTKELLETIGQDEFLRVFGPALLAIGQPGECQRFNYGGYVEYGEETEIHNTHADLLRGLVWATSVFNDETLIGFVGDAAEKCFQKVREVGPRSPKVGNACLFALSSLASEWAVAQLGRLKSRAKHVSTRKQIGKAFARASEAAGMSEADLVELGVPKFGMTEIGRIVQAFGDFNAQVTLHANKKTPLQWIKPDGKPQKNVPAAVKSEHADQLKTLKKQVKDIDKLMPSIRQRIEQLFLCDRSWSLADFRSRFLDHPVVGVVAGRLIWNMEVDEKRTPVIFYDDQFVDANDRKFEKLNEQTRVTLWHPMQSPADDVLQWRQLLETKQISQPFKQAHREVYILTDAERETAVYSNRFAAHIVAQHQLAALCHQRGWRYGLQGDWDSWNAPFLELPQHDLRVEFFVEPLEGLNEVTGAFIYTHLATDQVRFLHGNSGESVNLNHPLPLEEIPELVFSEVMRDVDLFVGVTSIGNDPNWQERDTGPAYTDYWQQFSFGELSQTAVTRMQTLQNVLPRLKIADQCRLEDRFLVVEGKLRTYKIHLGSGNILMSPNDEYLCIVQKRGSGTSRTDNIYLPFEGDNTLSLILSKAFLLADDDKIKDQTIVNQIRLDRD